MVLFGAYHSAERFVDADRLTAHFPGPGSYATKSVVEGAPVPRYASKLVDDGCVKPDGSLVLFRERDSWVRGSEGPKVSPEVDVLRYVARPPRKSTHLFNARASF